MPSLFMFASFGRAGEFPAAERKWIAPVSAGFPSASKTVPQILPLTAA